MEDGKASDGEDAPAGGRARDLSLDVARARSELALFSAASAAVRVGRYVVLERIGAGGMGVVYAAYDPTLERKVALKLVHASRLGSDGEQRLLREAKALAQLSHVNVVAIHDAGIVDATTLEHTADEDTASTVFIAMEFVSGCTLREWAIAASREQGDIVAALISAGRGLAAAHDAGLVHRDFKPDNVMMADDGRVRVMDFGLARAGAVVSDAPDIEDSRVETVDEALTRPGSIVGTPAYMSLEQLEGGSPDARSDQFSFCASAWELLYGTRPFPGRTIVEQIEAVRGGPPSPPSGASVPGFVHAVLVRGLAVASDRFPDMHALLAALGDDPSRRRRRRALVGVAVGSVVLVAAGVWLDRRRTASECHALGENITEIWNANVGARVRDRFVDTGVHYAAPTYERVQARFDAYARAWQVAREDACLAAEIEQSYAPEAYARVDECMNARRGAFAATVELFLEADATVVSRAAETAAMLPGLERCSDTVALALQPAAPDDGAQRDEVVAVRAALVRAAIFENGGRYEDGVAAGRDAVQRALATEWPPVIAEARKALGLLEDRAGHFEAAERELVASYLAACAAGHDELAADSTLALTWVVGTQLARFDDGALWGEQAQAWLDRLNIADTREATLLMYRGSIAHARGDFERALELREQGVAAMRAALTAGHPTTGSAVSSLGHTLRALGRVDEAIVAYREAVEIQEEALGPEHPFAASEHLALGLALNEKGDRESARAELDRALAIQRASLAPDHIELANTLESLGMVEATGGDFEKALEYYEAALPIVTAASDPTHPDVARLLMNIGNVHFSRGAYAEAIEHYQRGLAMMLERMPDHQDIAVYYDGIGLAYRALGDLPRAREQLELALQVAEKAAGPNHPRVAIMLEHLAGSALLEKDYARALGLGRRSLAIREATYGVESIQAADASNIVGLALLSLGELAEAEIALERALALRERFGAAPADLAETRFALARVLSGRREDPERAIALARRARDDYRAAGDYVAKDLADVERWLTEHDAGE